MFEKLVYVDGFGKGASGGYWLMAFKEHFHQVATLNVYSRRPEIEVFNYILKENPTHVHFGGSVKGEKFISYKHLKELRDKIPNIRITFFYGDAYHSLYHKEVAKWVDKIIMSHRPSYEVSNFEYCPCPTSLNPQKINSSKLYDVAFIGNRYIKEREDDLRRISEFCKLKVFGKGWVDSGFDWGGYVAFEEFPKVIAESKFSLGTTLYNPCEYGGWHRCVKRNASASRLCHVMTCKDYREKWGYFSNRVMNLFACRACVLMLYSEGLDELFTDGENIIFFKDINELKEKIELYKDDLPKLEEIGENAYKLSREYSFEGLVRRLL